MSVKLKTCNGSVRLIGAPQPQFDFSVPRKNASGVWYSYADGHEKMWIEKTGRRVIEGIASTGTVTSHNHSLNPRGCVVRFPIPLLFRHGFKKGTREYGYKHVDQARIGEVVMITKRQDAVVVRAVVDETLAGDAAWDRIFSGEARCFSVATGPGPRLKGIVDGDRFYDEWSLKEVSVCFRGANPDCRFEICAT